ncbi:zinc finger protein 277 [Anthonomus grandis grandis]|uniref:zinc finger protein 277 n=1 Tax=Anthonomus grandis grandis TaxID=2921223 RepID=UPI002166A5EC|nr:zinc finger protein 277 [Anthonomus grandis grandis]
MAAAEKLTGFADKMFGPLTFEDRKYEDIHITDTETKCLLCEDSFNLKLRLDIFLSHLFDVHHCVIEDVQNIKNLPQYILYWRDRFKTAPIEEIIPSVKVEVTGGQYFLLSSLLKEDQALRHKLTLDYVMKVHEFERTDEHFIRQCLLCKLNYEGSRQGYLEHLSEQHNLQLGNPQNLVFIEDLVHHINAKLEALTCIFCEGVFPDRNVLKEHMRKKLHKRINPSNSEYDKYYIVNYLEVGKSWRAIEMEDDRYALPRGVEENSDQEYSDWNEKADSITCLFCPHTDTDINILCQHMVAIHTFDFVQSTESLDYYQKVKLVNYLRKMVHMKKCPYCGVYFENEVELHCHLKDKDHCKVPEITCFDQPEFYFPTYENDAFLYLIDDVED